jgi:hypothetical protein
MSLVKEIGEEKMSDDEAKYAGQIVLAICNVLEGNGSGNTDFREVVEEYCDNGIYNLTKLKESLKEK